MPKFTCNYLISKRVKREKYLTKLMMLYISILFQFFLITRLYCLKLNFKFLVLFFISWSPYALVAMYSAFFSTNLHPMAGTIPAMFAKSSLLTSSLLYLCSNTQVKQTLRMHKVFRFKILTSITKGLFFLSFFIL